MNSDLLLLHEGCHIVFAASQLYPREANYVCLLPQMVLKFRSAIRLLLVASTDLLTAHLPGRVIAANYLLPSPRQAQCASATLVSLAQLVLLFDVAYHTLDRLGLFSLDQATSFSVEQLLLVFVLDERLAVPGLGEVSLLVSRYFVLQIARQAVELLIGILNNFSHVTLLEMLVEHQPALSQIRKVIAYLVFERPCRLRCSEARSRLLKLAWRFRHQLLVVNRPIVQIL